LGWIIRDKLISEGIYLRARASHSVKVCKFREQASMKNSRIKFSNLFEYLEGKPSRTANIPPEAHKGNELSMYDKIPCKLKPIFNRTAIDEYERQIKAELDQLRDLLKKKEAEDIIFWARPPRPIYVGRMQSVISHDRQNEILIVQMEEGVIKLAYGWSEEQQKLGRPIKIPIHFFKDPSNYIKAVKPLLYSLQQSERIEYQGHILFYKFIIS
jgi:hypothetical protein